MRDYPTHCAEVVYPMFSTLYDLKVTTNKDVVINTLLIVCSDYLADQDADMIGLELKSIARDCYNTITKNKQVRRKQLDLFLGDLLCRCGIMINASNREFNVIITNGKGKVKNHYSAKGAIGSFEGVTLK